MINAIIFLFVSNAFLTFEVVRLKRRFDAAERRERINA